MVSALYCSGKVPHGKKTFSSPFLAFTLSGSHDYLTLSFFSPSLSLSLCLSLSFSLSLALSICLSLSLTHARTHIPKHTHSPAVSEMVREAEDKLLPAVTSNQFHVLRHLFPPNIERKYSIRPRKHDFVLPPKDDKNFIPKVLYISMLNR